MNLIPTPFPEVLLLEPKLFQDERGLFVETYQQTRYQQLGITATFVQDNFSHSKKNVVRGLHYQHPHPQGKLVGVTRGKVLDVVVDIRLGSPTFGKSFAFILDDVLRRQAYISPGFAHGFCTLADEVDFYYKCTDYYHPQSEKGVIWNDPSLKIDWPISQASLSPKDECYPLLANIPHADLPIYQDQK